MQSKDIIVILTLTCKGLNNSIKYQNGSIRYCKIKLTLNKINIGLFMRKIYIKWDIKKDAQTNAKEGRSCGGN